MMLEVKREEVRRFIEECLTASGAPLVAAQAHADLLLHADTTGHFSHGINRLVFYINDITSGATNPSATPVVIKESAATALVDGKDALGATVGNFCMDLAIRKAKEAGIGWVSAKGSTHFGMAGYWALKAEKEGLIGMAFTNSSPILVPTRAKERAVGTNPIGMAAPASNGDSLVVDMAMTTAALGKIEMQIHKEEPLPKGWAFGPDGKVTTDAQLAFDTGHLLPLGGFEETSGYKGYGLAAMVEVFCSVLTGSIPSHKARPWTKTGGGDASNLGQCFVALNPDFFAPGFADRMSECLEHWRGLTPVDPTLPVLAPGDKERLNSELTMRKGTISYQENQINVCHDTADQLGVRRLRLVTAVRLWNSLPQHIRQAT